MEVLMKREYLKIATAAIQSYFDGSVLDKEVFLQEFPELKEKGASFVTLTLYGQLRGCIGSVIAHRALLDDIISNALSSAFKDPRFPPLTQEEFQDVKVEISILTPAQKVNYTDINDLKRQIHVGEDGVIIKQGHHQATFLPQVWDELPSFELFFAHLGQKAGLEKAYLNDFPEVKVYQVQKVKQE